MNHHLFRKHSVERISSAQQLNAYIRVASPGVWLILLAVVVFLMGILVWGIFGTVTTTLDAVAVCENGQIVCMIKDETTEEIKPGMTVWIEGQEGTIETVSPRPELVEGNLDAYVSHVGGFSQEDFYWWAEVESVSLADGIYPAKIQRESVHPIQFILQ